MQNSTDTARTSAAQYTQNKMGKGRRAEGESSGREVDGGGATRPNARRSKNGAKATVPKAKRQPPGRWAVHPTSSGAAMATSEAITFDSVKATARNSPCWSESADGMMTKMSEPINPMQNEVPMVISAD